MAPSTTAVTPTDVDTATQQFINGEWVPSQGPEPITSYDPANGSRIALIGSATRSEVSDAIAAARQAADVGAWSGLTPDQRSVILWRIGDLIQRDAERLAQLESLDQGQPLGIARNVSVAGAAAHFRYFAGWCTKLDGRVPAVSRHDAFAYTKREPVGVCALITPWNFPLLIAVWKLAPALAAGNTVVLKPAEQTSLTALALAELMHEAGVPAGVVNVVTGGADVGRQLVDDPRIDKISFTGSTAVGRSIVSASAGNLKRLTLELGGKAASVVCADADLDAAVAGNVTSATLNSGQVCGALSRFYVERSVYDEFVEKAAARVNSLVLGSGQDPATQMGPLTTREHRDGVHFAVERARSEGATVLAGGNAPDEAGLRDGAFYRPTILVDVDDTMACVQDEIFGPVMPIMPVDSLDEAVARANSSNYGLAASVWSRDIGTAHWLADNIKAGAVRINTVSGLDPAAPWGGLKLSGWGREMGPEALDAYTETKAIWVNHEKPEGR